jgi:hypothetical protein
MSTKPKEICVQFSLTVNLGNWNSAKLGCTLSDVIEPGEEFETKFDEVYRMIRKKVREELGRLSSSVKDASPTGG